MLAQNPPPAWLWGDDTPLTVAPETIYPSPRFGHSEGQVEEVLPPRLPGTPLDTPREPLYLLKRQRDALTERLSYLCARRLRIAYQTVRWVLPPPPPARARRARSAPRATIPPPPQVAVGFVPHALAVRSLDLAAQTCQVRTATGDCQTVPVQNAADYYRLLALGVFTEDPERGQLLYSGGWLFGHDLALGFGLHDLLFAPYFTKVSELLGLPERPAAAPNSTGIQGYLANFSGHAAARQIITTTLRQLATATDLPELLAADLRAAPTPLARELAPRVADWVARRQAGVAQVVAAEV